MPVNRPVALRNARLIVDRDAIDAGTGPGVLQIGTTGMAVVLADIVLADPCGTVASGVLTFSGFPRSDTSANASGRALAARFRDSNAADCLTGLTVGLPAASAPGWAASTAYTVGQFRTNGANIYRVTTAGTSAGSGGPTGTGASIADGTAVWEWYCVANADVQVDAIDITAGQQVQISSATITHAP